MTMIQKLIELRAAMKAKLEALNTKAVDEAGEVRSFDAAETAEFDAGMAEIRALDARIAELQEVEVREASAAAHRVETGTVNFGDGVTNEPNPVYRKDDTSIESASFFKDLFNANAKGDPAARARLASAQETRAGGTTVAGAGGQFAPPLWLVSDFVELARAGRVTADLMNKQVLPGGVSSVNLPKITTGSTEAVQATQNTSVSLTDLVTTSVSSGITTIAGQAVISLQLLKQSGIPFDRVILGDLARAYATQLDVQVISGSGAAGQLRGLLSTGVATTFTTATPKVTDGTTPANSFYNKLIAAVATISTTRFLPPNCIIMTPVRWGWLLEGLDSTGRPIITVNTPSFNALASADAYPVAQGPVGSILGLPVYLDPNIPANLGAGTNEDRVIVCRCDDLWLYETAVESQSFDATYANQMSVLYRVSGFSAFIPDRLTASVNVLQGTGMIVPAL